MCGIEIKSSGLSYLVDCQVIESTIIIIHRGCASSTCLSKKNTERPQLRERGYAMDLDNIVRMYECVCVTLITLYECMSVSV